MLSLVDHTLNMAERLRHGFMAATSDRETLVDYPLIAWRQSANGFVMDAAVKAVYEQLQRLKNPFMQKYVPLCEWTVPHLGVPIVSPTLVDGIVKSARDRGPLQLDEKDIVPITFLHRSGLRHPLNDRQCISKDV